MEKVAASKIRKAQKQMEASRPYAERIRRVVGHLAHANPDYKHPYLTEREVSRVGYIVISTDRGLCGGLNANLFKCMIGELSTWQGKNVEVDLALVGAKAVAFFRQLLMQRFLAAMPYCHRQYPSINSLIRSSPNILRKSACSRRCVSPAKNRCPCRWFRERLPIRFLAPRLI